MLRILIAGGTGSLGTAVVNQLRTTDHRIRVLSRKTPRDNLDTSIEWAQGNVASSADIVEALSDIDIVVNCLGDARNVHETDVLGVKRFAELAQQGGIKHFFHISIVGIEHIDLDYYRHKQSAEAAVIESGVPYSIQRLTQFHSLLEFMMKRIQTLPDGYVLPVAGDAQFQMIDTRDAAAYIVPLLLSKPGGRLPDVGGPEILRVDDIARIFLNAQGVTDPELINPDKGFFPPNAVEGYRRGMNTVPDNRYGQITWATYVHEHRHDT